MKKNSFIFIMPVLVVALSLVLGIVAYGTGVFNEASSDIDSDVNSVLYSDECSADVAEKELLSYLEQCEKDWEEKRKDPRPFDINDATTWYAEAKDGGLDAETAALAKAGMTIEEAVAALGEPQRNVGSGVIIFEWDMRSGEILQMGFYKVGAWGSNLFAEGWESGMVNIYSPDEKDKK